MVAVCVTATPLIVAETVLAPATLEDSVAVVTPEELVAAGVLITLLLPDALIVTAAPLMTLPNASLAVTVMMLDPLLAVMVDAETEMVDWLALGTPTGISETALEQSDSPPMFSTAMQ